MFDPENPPEIIASAWLNVEKPMPLKSLRGKVVVMAAFQMLCKGSNNHALPQMTRLSRSFQRDEVEIIGLHMVFENHGEMTPQKLAEFATEHDLDFPIAIDKAGKRPTDDLPMTMAAYEIQGTPTILLFDRQGRLRRHYLGQVDDLRLGAEIMALAMEDAKAPREASIAVERRLQATLSDPHDHDHHGHDHEGGCCGGHHHDHDHDHDHAHAHGEGGCDGSGGCGGKGGCGSHDHAHSHEKHVHGPGCNHDHDHGHDPKKAVADAVKAQLQGKR
ncbi:MAG: redoxin domain-containing protein [Hyphomicrobiaceae bacterium]